VLRKKLSFAVLVFLCALPFISRAQSGKEVSECEKAGGTLTVIKECDGSESLWCTISEREQCYADQVADGKCTVGEYSEELKGIVGVTPRVLCDNGQ